MRYRISKYKHLHSNRFRYLSSSIPLVCASGLLVVLGMMINPASTSEKVHAWVYGNGDSDSGTSSTTGSVTMTFENGTVTNEQVNVVAGSPVTSDAKYFTITPSGNVEKYSIYVQTSSSTNGSLVGSSASNSATIPTLGDKETGVALSSMSTNTWGYALETGRKTASSMMYKGISGSTNAVSAYNSIANPTAAQDFTLAFAANIGDNNPSDHYIANVIVSVAANPGEVTTSLGFAGVETMQTLTTALCKDTPEHTTGQLRDIRDDKIYWVTKLKDGNCWMTQNLDYDDPGGTRRTGVTKPDVWSGSSSSQNVREYWDPGEMVVSGTSLAVATDSTDRHLSVGNYYSYASATAGTAPSAAGEATSSVCPGGWKLPTSNSTNSGSFGGLVSGLSTSSDSALLIAPYYFVRGGRVNSGGLTSAGGQGYYWSSTATNSTHAYILTFYSSFVNPSDDYNRYFGQSVRCLVQGS